MNKVKMIFMVVAFVALIGFGGCTSSHMYDHDQFIVGMNVGFPPYEMLDDNGNIVGFDVDVIKRVAQVLGKKLVIKDMAFDSLIVALKQGKIDAIISGMAITQSRLKQLVMVHYQGLPFAQLPLLFWNQIPSGVKTVEDLQKLPNKTVCAQIGTIQDEIISTYTFLDIKHLENVADLIADIKYGKSIATVLEPAVAKMIQKKLPQIKMFMIPLKPGQQGMGDGIGVHKSNIRLIVAITKAVAQLKAAGTLKALEQFWFEENAHVSA